MSPPTRSSYHARQQTEGNVGYRWVRLASSIPWDGLADGYYRKMSSKAGRPAKDARLVIGAVIIQDYLREKDRQEAIAGIRRGMTDVKNGRVTEAEVFFKEFEEKYGIPSD